MDPFCIISTLVIPSTECQSKCDPTQSGSSQKQSSTSQPSSNWWPLDLQSNVLPQSYEPIFFVWFQLNPSTECRNTPKAIVNQHVWIKGPKWPYPIGFEPKAIINFPTRFQLVTTWFAIKCPTIELWTHFLVWFQLNPSTECWNHKSSPTWINRGPNDLLIYCQMLYHWATDPFCMISTLVIPSTECHSNSDPTQLGSSQKQSSPYMDE